MEFEDSTLRRGLEAGMARGCDAFSTFVASGEHLSALENNLRIILRSWPTGAHPRFVRLFAELYAIAAVARAANNEVPLSEDDLRSFLGHAFVFFNSFKHR
jgi:hypothetical protein